MLLINEKTRIKDLLDAKQDEVILALVKLNKNFSKLKNPLLRNLFARRVTIADACKIAGSAVTDFMDAMKAIGFEVLQNNIARQEHTDTENAPHALETTPAKETTPAAWNLADGVRVVELDVRPILADNKDPLKQILNTVKALQAGDCLKLINTFEPIPLIYLLVDKGFTHHTEIIAEDMVVTYFQSSKPGQNLLDAQMPANPEGRNRFDEVWSHFEPSKIKYIDVRDLEMPQPMLRIMGCLEELDGAELLFVHHKKIPVLLLPELEKRGFSYLFKEVATGGVNMLIYTHEFH